MSQDNQSHNANSGGILQLKRSDVPNINKGEKMKSYTQHSLNSDSPIESKGTLKNYFEKVQLSRGN